jgi:hypothetical protein
MRIGKTVSILGAAAILSVIFTTCPAGALAGPGGCSASRTWITATAGGPRSI